MSELSQEQKLKEVLSDLANLMIELIGICYEEGKTPITPGLVEFVKIHYVDKYRIDDMMDNFIKYTRLHWKKIEKRDEAYFINDAIKIFGDIPSDQVNITKVLFESKGEKNESIISQEDKNAIWDMVTSMVRISIVHIHKSRKPIRDVDGQIKYTHHAYSQGDYEVSNLQYHANKFKLDLNKYV